MSEYVKLNREPILSITQINYMLVYYYIVGKL